MSLSIENMIEMDHKLKKSEFNGYLVLRWLDKNLRWNPLDWGGIDMIYTMPENIWTPDLNITNMTNWETVNFTKSVLGEYQIRIWADKSFMSDVEGKEFNVEYTPIITFEVFHEFSMKN